MIAFTVPLTRKDWDATMGGWRCSALKIPGAVVSGLYSGSTKLDDSWYQPSGEDEIVRWSHGEPPEFATLSVRVPEDLKTGSQARQEAEEQSVFWKRLTVAVPIITAVISGPMGWFLKPPSPEPARAAPLAGLATEHTCETWTVTGETNLAQLRLKSENVLVRMEPPTLVVDPGEFKWDIPVPVDSGKPVFPRINLIIQDAPNVPNPPAILLGVKGQRIDWAARSIELKPIKLTKNDDSPYDGAAAAHEQEQAKRQFEEGGSAGGTDQ